MKIRKGKIKKKVAKGPKVPTERQKARILVVDDEVDFAQMIQTTLIQTGYRVDKANNGAQAIELHRRNLYDLAIVDIRMPEMTGLELLQYLKSRDQKIAVIIMTAYGSFSVGIESLKRGAADYLPKPFRLGDLRSKVQEALRRRSRFLHEQTIFTRTDTVDEW